MFLMSRRSVIQCYETQVELDAFSLICSIIPGSRGSRHSTDSGTTSDSGEARDNVFEEPSSPFRSSMEMSPPVSPTTPSLFQKGAYISKVKSFISAWL